MHKLDTIKLQKSIYYKMDETALGLYGITKTRLALVVKLRSKCFSATQIIFIVLLAIFIITAFIVHDIYIDNIAEEIYMNLEDGKTQ